LQQEPLPEQGQAQSLAQEPEPHASPHEHADPQQADLAFAAAVKPHWALDSTFVPEHDPPQHEPQSVEQQQSVHAQALPQQQDIVEAAEGPVEEPVSAARLAIAMEAIRAFMCNSLCQVLPSGAGPRGESHASEDVGSTIDGTWRGGSRREAIPRPCAGAQRGRGVHQVVQTQRMARRSCTPGEAVLSALGSRRVSASEIGQDSSPTIRPCERTASSGPVSTGRRESLVIGVDGGVHAIWHAASHAPQSDFISGAALAGVACGAQQQHSWASSPSPSQQESFGVLAIGHDIAPDPGPLPHSCAA
jgi:hypothetical protein